MTPLAVNIEFMNAASMTYLRCIATSLVGFANGMAPIMAVEVARRGLTSDVKPRVEALESMLKTLNNPARK
jgi:flagellar motor component MotA